MATINRRFYLKNEELATKSYADSSFTAARTYADTKKQEAINASNNYTDTAISNNNANYLAKNNNTYYEPSSAYNPATKQYVDEQKTQYATMPNANSGNVGQIIQYVGSTTPNYTQGHFYICINGGGNYYWQDILVQDTPPSIPTFDVDNGDTEEYGELLGMVEDAPDGFIVTHITGGNIGDAIGTLTIVAENAADFTWYDANGNLKYVTISVETDIETGDPYIDVSDVVSTPLASKAYVTGAVNTAINNLDITKREVVNQLPTENISTKTIYMVPNTTPGSQNIYDEYIWLGDRWEMIGDTHIDLTDYATKDYVNGQTVHLPATVLGLNTNLTPQEVIAYLGGAENAAAILDAITNEKGIVGLDIYNGLYGNIPVFVASQMTGNVRYIYLECTTQSDLDRPTYTQVCLAYDPATEEWSCVSKTDKDLAYDEDIVRIITGTMPAADDYPYNTGKMVQYMGATTNEYVHGHFYQNVNNGGTHSWEQVDVQDLSSYLSKTNMVPYTPTQDYNPTTKKYVDDAVAASGGCQRDTVPTADSAHVGDIIQYTGPTNEYYTNGYFYICVEQAGSGVPVYTWEQINVQDQPDLSNYVTAAVLNNMELNNIRMNFPCYYIDAISFDTVEPYITPSFEDVQAIVIAKMQQAYNDGKTKFYLIYRNANSTHPLRYFPVLIDINTNTGVITTTGYKQVCSVNSTEAVSFTVSMDYGTWSLVNGLITHTGEHIGGYIVNKSTFNYLAKNNITAYTPTLDYHPATKRYVDEQVTNEIPNASSLVTVETMPTANASHFGKVLLYAGGESNVYWMPGHMYQCQRWEDEQQNVTYHWVDIGKRDAYDYFMPEPSEENYDVIIQYKGQTDANYVNGAFYKCVAHVVSGEVTYAWEYCSVDRAKPDVIWESDTPANYLTAIQADLSASPAWQLTGLDLTPYKRIKIYSCAGQGTGTTASASTTPAMILEMSLDPRAAISAYGGNYCGSVIAQKPNDNNRVATLTCAVSADKTKFVVLRQTNLYGTMATSNNDVNANVFLIEGYYN